MERRPPWQILWTSKRRLFTWSKEAVLGYQGIYTEQARQGQTTDGLESQAVLDVTCSREPVQIPELESDLMSRLI